MRCVALLAVVTLVGSALCLPVSANTAKARVRVKLKVDRTCTLQAPQIRTNGAREVLLTLGSFLRDCNTDDVPATLTVVTRPAGNGSDVATINF